MNRIDAAFCGDPSTRRKILSLFLTAGFPDRSVTPELAAAAAGAGADILEIGIPFSDPLADGPVIQECSRVALERGMTTRDVFSMVGKIRKSTEIPIILMGYANTMLSYGIESFMKDARLAGADGTIIADLPVEESGAYRGSASDAGMETVFMVTPTSSDSRIREIDRLSGGFVYAVTVNGVTGERSGTAESARAFIARARNAVTRNPLLAGFGISDPQTASSMARDCDGVIIGSAVMSRIRRGSPEPDIGPAIDFISSVRSSLDL